MSKLFAGQLVTLGILFPPVIRGLLFKIFKKSDATPIFSVMALVFSFLLINFYGFSLVNFLILCTAFFVFVCSFLQIVSFVFGLYFDAGIKTFLVSLLNIVLILAVLFCSVYFSPKNLTPQKKELEQKIVFETPIFSNIYAYTKNLFEKHRKKP